LTVASETRYQSGLKAACFTPLSFFHRNLDLEYTQLRCFGLITVETLGAGREFAEISTDRFAEQFSVSREWILNAIAALDASGMIRIRPSDRGRPTYAIREEYIQEAKNAGKETIKGKCPDCQKVGEFSTEFIPVPHQALRKLGGCVNSVVFRVVMVVIRYTLKWGRQSRLIEVEPSELSLNDFTRLTGLESREITTGLTEAVKLGLIGRELRSGRPSLFWAIPEKFGALDQREARQVTQPTYREKTANAKTVKSSEKPQEPESTHENESRSFLWGRCQNCRRLVAVEPITEAEFEQSQPPPPPEHPPRSGPPPDFSRKKPKKERIEATREKLLQRFRGKYAD
jgi:hypothetical protein